MTDRLKLRFVLAALMCIFVAGCGGGGGGDGADSISPPQTPPPSPSTPPSPPPGMLRPMVFMEHDPNGDAYIRVLEQIYDPFAPGVAQRTLANLTVAPDEIEGPESTAITNVHLNQEKYGFHILGTGIVSITDYSYVDFDGFGSIHGAAIKVERSAGALTYIQRAFADGLEPPDYFYTTSNTDFLGVELQSGPVYVRGATGRNFGDAGVDTKSTNVYLMNVTLSSGNRMLRAWDGVNIIVVNSIINRVNDENSAHAWLYDDTASIQYYNTLWCTGSSDPSPTDPNCSTSPVQVEGEVISGSQAATHITPLTSNPLPGISPFFATQIDRIVVDYSTDNGATWQEMVAPNAGGGGLAAPVGDTRYRIPLNLASANFRFRARFKANGVQVGPASVVIDENGAVVP